MPVGCWEWAFSLVLAAPAAAGLLGLGSGGSLALSAVTAVTTGLLLSWLATGPAGYGAALFLSMLAVAGAVVAMLGVYRRLIGSAPESERR